MKSKEKNRSFGLLFFAVFTLICFWPLINGEKPRLFLFPFAIIFLILGILNSKFLTPFNKAWIKFGEFLGMIIAPIVMGVVYFIILTPISFLIRIAGKDLLNTRYSKKLKSYWIKRKKDLGSMNKQF